MYPGGCVYDPADVAGHTWTSVDGRDWREMKQSWLGRWMNVLFVVDRTLVGVGPGWDKTPDNYGFVRTAVLPTEAPAAGPVPTLAPTPTPGGGCGG